MRRVRAPWRSPTPSRSELFLGLILVPVVVSVLSARDFVRESRLADDRYEIERRAEEVLTQDQLAPQRWAARLAPDVLPDLEGFEVGRVYKAGTGLMAGTSSTCTTSGAVGWRR